MRGKRSLAIVWTALAAVACAPAANAAPGLTTGFLDGAAYQAASDQDRAIAFQHTRAARAGIVRLKVHWSGLAPQRPPSRAEARNAAWSGYDWAPIDAAVRGAVDAGLRPLLFFFDAPAWAEGPGRPRESKAAPAGSWKPSPQALSDLAFAAATRYSGRYLDPVAQVTLPRVRNWQTWNEPNLTTYLTPQWKKRRGHIVPASPSWYRAMQNAFYVSLKAVDPTNLSVTAGTAPYGDPYRGRRRMQPALFTREMLCVRDRVRLRAFRCADAPIRFDALAHHPYPLGSPRRHAVNPDDVAIPDLAKLTRPLAAARRAHKILPVGPKQLWATEISWESDPPDPAGIPVQLHARYLEGALFTLWKQGASVVVWQLLRDGAKGPGYEFTYQSGIYQRAENVAEDTPKPSFTAFSFPFTAYIYGGKATLWGIAPAPGPVVVEQRAGGAWRSLVKLEAGQNRVFVAHRRLRVGSRLRARQGSEASLAWRVISGRNSPVTGGRPPG